MAGIQLVVELDDKGTPKIHKIESSLDKLKDKSRRTGGQWKKNWRGMARDVDSLSAKVGKFASGMPAILGAAGLAGSFGMVAKSGLEFNASLESIETQFRVILGDADKTKKVMADIVKFSAETPFQLQEVAQAGKMLEAFGLGGIENLKLVGDAAAAAGRPIEEIAMTFGRIKSGAFGEAFMKLAETGLATRDMLEAEGLQFDKGGSFTGSADEAMAAVQRIVQRRYGGMMKEMSGTWGGAMSTMRDNWGMLTATLMKPSFERLKPRIAQATNALIGFTKSGDLAKWAKRTGNAIDGFITGMIATVKWVRVAWTYVSLFGEILGTAALTIGIVVTAQKAWTIAQAAYNAVANANPLGIIITGIAILVPLILRGVKAIGGWGVAWEYLKATMTTVWSWGKVLVTGMVKGAGELKTHWREAAKALWVTMKAAFWTIMDYYEAMFNGLKKGLGMIVDAFGSAGELLKAVFSGHLDEVPELAKKAWATMKEDGADLASEFKTIGEGRWAEVGEAWAGTVSDEFKAIMNQRMEEAGDSAAEVYAFANRARLEALASDGHDPLQTQDPTGGGGDGGAGGGDEGAETENPLTQMQLMNQGFREMETELWNEYWTGLRDMGVDSFGDAFADTILDSHTNLGENLGKVWDGMKSNFVKGAFDMAGAWIKAKIKMWLVEQGIKKAAAAASVTDAVISSGASKVEASSAASAAAAKYHMAYAGIPFFGQAMATSSIGIMMGSMAGASAAAMAFRSGGGVPGVGSGVEDDQLAMVSGGEFVQPKSAVSQYGEEFMEAVRTGTYREESGGDIHVHIADGGSSDFERDVEDQLVPVLENLFRQRRLSFA